jgi:hypothetical protein
MAHFKFPDKAMNPEPQKAEDPPNAGVPMLVGMGQLPPELFKPPSWKNAEQITRANRMIISGGI